MKCISGHNPRAGAGAGAGNSKEVMSPLQPLQNPLCRGSPCASCVKDPSCPFPLSSLGYLPPPPLQKLSVSLGLPPLIPSHLPSDGLRVQELSEDSEDMSLDRKSTLREGQLSSPTASVVCSSRNCQLPISYFEMRSKHRLVCYLSLERWRLVVSDTEQKVLCLEGRALSPGFRTLDRAKS